MTQILHLLQVFLVLLLQFSCSSVFFFLSFLYFPLYSMLCKLIIGQANTPNNPNQNATPVLPSNASGASTGPNAGAAKRQVPSFPDQVTCVNLSPILFSFFTSLPSSSSLFHFPPLMRDHWPNLAIRPQLDAMFPLAKFFSKFV